MNEVTAVMQRLAKPMLQAEVLADFPANAKEIIVTFQNDNSYKRARAEVESGQGIGWRLVRRYLGKGDEDACPRSKQEINDAIAAVKASGRGTTPRGSGGRKTSADATYLPLKR